jgi:hypothetical protein
MRVKLLIVIVVAFLAGCQESTKNFELLPGPNQKWQSKYGDTKDTKIAYNIVVLRAKAIELDDRVKALEDKNEIDKGK